MRELGWISLGDANSDTWSRLLASLIPFSYFKRHGNRCQRSSQVRLGIWIEKDQRHRNFMLSFDRSWLLLVLT